MVPSFQKGILLQPSFDYLAQALDKCRNGRHSGNTLCIYAFMQKAGLAAHIFHGNQLVPMLVDVGSFCHAQHVFDGLVYPGRGSLDALIAGYTNCGESQHAVTLYENMSKYDFAHLSVRSYTSLLKACAALANLEMGLKIHAEMVRLGFLNMDLFVGSALIDVYAKCDALGKARELFDSLVFRDVVTWNALISGYAEHDWGEEAIGSLEKMLDEGVSPDAITFLSLLKACGRLGETNEGHKMYFKIVNRGLLEESPTLCNALIDMYAKCGSLLEAHHVFNKLKIRDVIAWTTLISGYAEHGLSKEALSCFKQMQLEGVNPNATTYSTCLKTCGCVREVLEIHAEIERKGLVDNELLIGSILVCMYAGLGPLAKAQEVFDKLRVRNVVSWTAILTGYVDQGHGKEALHCFEQMELQGVPPNAVTFVCGLKACGMVGAANKGKEIHSRIKRNGLLVSNVLVSNALLYMYAKCACLSTAQQVFETLTARDLVSWNALIAGYVEHGGFEEALDLCDKMQLEGVFHNSVTFLCALKACGAMGAKERGERLHIEIERKGLLDNDLMVGTAVVDMYAKFGLVSAARRVFDKLSVRGIVSCNLLMMGYAQVGETVSAFQFFDSMVGEGVKPDPVTFVIVLNVCSQAGLFCEGHSFFEAMGKDFGIPPAAEHYNCIVDLVVRVGRLDKAGAAIKQMPFYPDPVAWLSVLSASMKWGNIELGKKAFEQAVSSGDLTECEHEW